MKTEILRGIEKKILRALRTDLKMDPASTKDFLETMLARRCHLHPEEIQSRGALFMFIR